MLVNKCKKILQSAIGCSLLFFFFHACQSANKFAEEQPAEKVQITSPTVELKGGLGAAKEAEGDITISPLDSDTTAAPTITIPEQPAINTKPIEITITTPSIPPQQVPYRPTVVHTGLAAELVVDASGSMNGILGADTKFNIIKDILSELTIQWATLKAPVIHLGLRTFGSEELLEAKKCDDSKLLLPPASIDVAAFKKSLEAIQAKGESPLAFAMRKGAEDLALQNEDRVMIVLTDGKDTCDQDPCAVAGELYEGQFKIVTHVVAFDIDKEEEPALRCIADRSKGVFLLARNKEELVSALDEALRSTVPYNLRLKVMVGGTPLPTTVTVYKAGTQEVIEKQQSFGIELFRLKPGAYDILVEYTASIAEAKPSKILKGVELTSQGKVEQELRFDLASVTLSAHDAKGEPAPTQFTFYKAGTQNLVAKFTSNGEEITTFIDPGTYDLIANRSTPGQEMTLTEPGIQVSTEQGFIKHFAFQTGTLVLKGQTSGKQPVAMIYRVTKEGKPDAVVAQGQVESTGGSIELPPGVYDVHVEGLDPAIQVQPQGDLKGIAIEGGAIKEQIVTLVVGTFNLQAFNPADKPAPVEFKILDAEGKEVAKLIANEGKASVALPPGKYTIQAHLISMIYTKPPMMELQNVVLEEGKASEQKLKLELGTLKLLGRNAREQRITSTFYIYGGGSEEVVAVQGPVSDWVQFDLLPGNYDIKAVDAQASVEPRPSIWLRDITIEANALYVREAVFTNAKLRLIGRGTNSEVLPVEFKVYQYGHDRALLSGITGQDWQSFDIQPGKYYIEASYHDPESSQLLKKWINLKVAENELVEQELRF